jgi:hypothetical protein
MDYQSSALSFRDWIASNNFVSEGNPNATPIAIGFREGWGSLVPVGKQERSADAAKFARQHDELAEAARRLEEALASACSGRQEGWQHEVRAALGAAIKTLRVHAKAAGDSGGTTAEVERVRGRPPEITEIANQHWRVLNDAELLLTELVDTRLPIECREVRRRGLPMTSALHLHRGFVADLLLDIFQVDIGGEG